jgi:hypothetical protein
MKSTMSVPIRFLPSKRGLFSTKRGGLGLQDQIAAASPDQSS